MVTVTITNLIFELDRNFDAHEDEYPPAVEYHPCMVWAERHGMNVTYMLVQAEVEIDGEYKIVDSTTQTVEATFDNEDDAMFFKLTWC